MKKLFGLLAILILVAMAVAQEAPPAAKPGFDFQLSSGQAETQQSRNKVAKTSPLPQAAVEHILARLAPLKVQADDRKTFAMRERSAPPPKTGQTISQPFPPATQATPPEKPPAGPLQVLRRAPEGPVDLAPQLSVTFNQPMVPITSIAELQAKGVPVQLTPTPKGKWRWVGSQTLLFDPEPSQGGGRFPMATDYRVEIPAGTASVTGAQLTAAVDWTFKTPPPRLLQSFPRNGPQVLKPMLFLAFDQAIDPQAVLKNLRLGAGQQTFPVRLASSDEVALDQTVRRLSDAQEHKDRWLALVPEQALGAYQRVDPLPNLPPATTFTVTVGKGTPSLEGPLTTLADQSFSFFTYHPLAIQDSVKNPRPLQTLWLRFNNPLDDKKFSESLVQVQPAIPDMSVQVNGQMLSVTGKTKGRTAYQLHISPNLTDSFGQTLGKPADLTFQVGSAEPSFQAEGGAFQVLDPAASPKLSFYTVNHRELKVRALAVGPEDWEAFHKWAQERSRDVEHPPEPPGREVLSTTVPIQGQPDEQVETTVDLKGVLPKGVGQLLVICEPTDQPPEKWRRSSSVSWVQVTHIGLDAFEDGDRLIGWANALKDGSPLPQVQLQLYPQGSSGSTDAQGFATLALDKPVTMLLARQGDDLAFLPANPNLWATGSAWGKRGRSDRLAWYVADDRQMYKPGEQVHVKGWVRRIQAGPSGDVGLAQGIQGLTYKLTDSQGNKIAEGQTELVGLGGFELKLDLPKTVNLGQTNLQLEAKATGVSGTTTQHQFQVQEFRRPEFEVSASASQGACFVGGSSTVTVSANYYAGGGLPNAEVNWNVSAVPGSFSPPNWPGYSFGSWTPWWDCRLWWLEGRPTNNYPSQSFQGHTDASGKHVLKLDFKAVNPPRPTSVTASANVQDVNRQAWGSSATLLVHPASVYVGLKSERTFVQQGQPLALKLIVTDLDGKPVSGRNLELKSYRSAWRFSGGRMITEEKDLHTQQLTSTQQPLAVTVPTGKGGTYQVEVTVSDAQGRPNQSQLTLWVAGGKLPPARKVEQQQVTLVPDKKEYQPGEVAEILVQTPFSPAQAIMTVRREGLVKQETLNLPQGTATLKVPIEEHNVPNLVVQVDAVGSAARTMANGDPVAGAAPRPAYATGSLNLAIPPRQRTLQVEVKPAVKALEPGAQTDLELSLKDAAGKPVADGEMAVVMVDESVLALTGYSLANPLGNFYPNRASDVSDAHLRSFVTLARPEDTNRQEAAQDAGHMLRGGGATRGVALEANGSRLDMREKANFAMAPAWNKPAPQPQIKLRTDFSALALWAPSVRTDALGQARVHLKVPDSLTRYRIMAVAVAGGQYYGKGESTLTARLPLMVRPSAPRFLNFGDRCEFPVVVQNQTDQPMQVEVAMRASNAKLTEGAGRSLTVPANDRVEVRFPVTTEAPGTARFQVGASAGKWSDAAELSLPVWTPATTEAFATYGTLDEGAIAQPVQAPGEVYSEFGGLQVTTTSTAVAELTDAFLYLQSYPFECSEQIASRVLSVAALRDVLSAFQAPGLPGKGQIEASMKHDLERLAAQQNYDGGWDYWVRGKPSIPYLSLHVAHALARAKQKGYAVPSETLNRSHEFLRTIENHIPPWYPDECKRSIRAYALYVRRLLGDPDLAKARALVHEAPIDKLPLETLGWLLPTLSKEPEAADIRKHLTNRASETAATAQFSTSYGDGNYLLLYSDRRVDAVLLEALIQDDPKSTLIPKLVRGLLDHRKAGRWGNTQENCFVLLALDLYFNTFEKVTPDFVARVWLANGLAGEQAFKGRSTDKNQLDIPMSFLKGTEDLVLGKTGPGRLYYRIGMTYAPKNLKLPPAEYGFTVQRSYQAVKDNRDVRQDPDGSWHIKAGAEVRVRLTMVANSRRYMVALVDPLPAGLEALNPALAVTGDIPKDPQAQKSQARWWWWYRPWYEHQNLRDERVEAFTSLLWEGVFNYSYVARATTPGNFVVPPAKAEEMYHPETFGRSGSDRVIVE